MNTRQRRQGVFCALLSAVIFGTMPLAASVFYERGGNADSLVFYRNFLALPFLFLLMRREGCAPLGAKRLLSLALLAFFNAVTPLLLFNSYSSIPTGMATTLHFSYPIFVLLGAAFFCGERITPLKALCVGLCTLGVALFYSPGQSVALIGMVIAFVSGITYAAYVVYLDKSGLKGLPPFQMVFWTCLFASAFAASYSLWQGRMRASFSLPVWGLLVGFAVMVSVISLVLFQLGVKKIGPSQASVFSTFEPLASILWGVTLLGERFTLRTGLGVGAILAAVLLLALKGDAEKSPAQESTAR